MKLLLDTHAWLWWISAPTRLRDETRNFISANTTKVFFSVVTSWEVVIKHGLGRLSLSEEPSQFIPKRIKRDQLTILPVKLEHTLEVARLPNHHKDPFDRLLVAQARVEGYTLVTSDQMVLQYPVQILNA